MARGTLLITLVLFALLIALYLGFKDAFALGEKKPQDAKPVPPVPSPPVTVLPPPPPSDSH